MIRYNHQYKPLAQHLRKNMTRQESHLWYDFLRNLPVQVKRQKQFADYIVDFYIPQAHIVIELDGSQHYEEEAMDYDTKRSEFLEARGLKVVRVTNHDVDRNFSDVCTLILREIGLYEG